MNRWLHVETVYVGQDQVLDVMQRTREFGGVAWFATEGGAETNERVVHIAKPVDRSGEFHHLVGRFRWADGFGYADKIHGHVYRIVHERDLFPLVAGLRIK